MILNLDKAFNPLNGQKEIQFEAFTFKGGEPHIKIQSKIEANEIVYVAHRIQTFNDFGLLLVAINALQMMKIKDIRLILPYFPGARQDRLMVNGEPLTVKVYADIINNLNVSEVIVFDAHSDVTTALLNNCTPVNNFKFVEKVTQAIGEDLILISPDGGALKKIYKLAAYLQEYPVVECSKIRDVKTGKLTAFKVYADNLENKNCLIVDDMCDGGGTFLGLAEELKKKNAGALHIAVSHGLFTRGTDTLKEQFSNIYATDSFKSNEDPNVHIIELNTII